MSTTEEPPAQAPPPPQPPPTQRPRRTVQIVLGSLLAVFGALLAIGGGAVLAIFGGDGALDSGPEQISTPTSALVSSIARIDGANEVPDVIGKPSIRVDTTAAQGNPDVFVGVGPAAAVDRYLAGAPLDRVRDFDLDPFRLDKARRDGSATPEPPADQTFWVARSDDSGKLDWKIRDGDYRFVVMNADGSRGVATEANFEVELPGMPEIAIGVLVVGLLMLGGGLVLAIGTGRRRRD
jgi:hypothetical protein